MMPAFFICRRTSRGPRKDTPRSFACFLQEVTGFPKAAEARLSDIPLSAISLRRWDCSSVQGFLSITAQLVKKGFVFKSLRIVIAG
jgi:hypothetical protein